MKVALIGPPQSGKSTVFAAVTGQSVDPAAMDKERLAVVKLPEPRLAFLAQLFKPKKSVEVTFEFLDVPGFSLADHHGQAELKRHLPNIRQTDALVAVVRAFESDSVLPYRDRIDPKADLDELHAELLFADLETVTSRIEKLETSAAKQTKVPEDEKREIALLHRCRDVLENDRPLSDAIQNDDEKKIAGSFQFLTEKPFIAVINVSDRDAAADSPFQYEKALDTLALSSQTEAEIAQLPSDDQAAFLEDLGVRESAGDRLLKTTFHAMGLISFLTGGGTNEVRAWPLRKNATALEAAGKIHTDIAKGFIRAETVAFEDLEAAGDMKNAKAAGKVRLEGKTYQVQDGDVITFRFNV